MGTNGIAGGRGGRGRGFGGGGFGGFNLNGPHATREELLQRMHDHIATVVGRYKGKVKVWDVVNEAIADGGTNILRDRVRAHRRLGKQSSARTSLPRLLNSRTKPIRMRSFVTTITLWRIPQNATSSLL